MVLGVKDIDTEMIRDCLRKKAVLFCGLTL